MGEEQYYLSISARVVKSEKLNIDLVELSESALLRSFAAEHGTDGEKLGHGIGGVHAVLHIGADN